MRLYHFIDQKWGIKNIKRRRLKVSRIISLNDPFESYSMDLSKEGHKEEFEALKKQISKDIGILCFSKSWQNPVQWSHYADKHKGLCLVFEMKQENALEVEYIEERYDTEFTNKLFEGRLHSPEINKWISSKYIHWKYEQEYRYIIDLKNKIRDRKGLIYKDFDEYEPDLFRIKSL